MTGQAHDEIEVLRRQVDLLQARQDIRDCLTRYCRGVDRLDRALVLSAYHADAIDDHGSYVGGPDGFVDWAFALHGTRQRITQHVITNHYCDLDGDVAHTETYYLFAAMNRIGPPFSMGGGRYIDRLERRGGRWAITARKCLRDWTANPEHSNLDAREEELLALFDKARRDPDDASYERPLTINPERLRLWQKLCGRRTSGEPHDALAR